MAATAGLAHFHVDEVRTFYLLQESLADIARDRLKSTHSPVYFWLMKPMTAIPGPPYLLRLPSVLFCAIGLAAMVTALSRHFDNRLANIFGVGLATSPAWIYIAHFARPYALLAMLFMFIFISMFLIIKPILEDGNEPGGHRPAGKAPWVVLTLSAIAANTVMMAGVLHSVALATVPLFNSTLRRDPAFLRKWLLAMTPVLVTAAAMSAILSQSITKRVNVYWLEKSNPFSEKAIRSVFEGVFVSGATPDELAVAILITAILLLGGIIFHRRYSRALFWSSVPLGIGLPLLLIVLSLNTSLLHPRYFYLVAPAWFILAAMTARQALRSRWVVIPAFGLLAVLLVQDWYVFQRSTRNSTWVNFAKHVRQLREPPGAIVMAKGSRVRTLAYLFDYEFPGGQKIEIRAWPKQHDKFKSLISELAPQHDVIWLVDRPSGSGMDPLTGTGDGLAVCRLNIKKFRVHAVYTRQTGTTQCDPKSSPDSRSD